MISCDASCEGLINATATAASSFPVSPRAITKLSRQEHASEVRAKPSATVFPVPGAGELLPAVDRSINNWYMESEVEK